jgi:hypothetical protein
MSLFRVASCDFVDRFLSQHMGKRSTKSHGITLNTRSETFLTRLGGLVESCCYYRRRGDKTMSDVVDHDAEALQSSHAEQRHVTRFGKHYFVHGFKTLGTDDGIASLACDLLLSSRREIAFTQGLYVDAGQKVSG